MPFRETKFIMKNPDSMMKMPMSAMFALCFSTACVHGYGDTATTTEAFAPKPIQSKDSLELISMTEGVAIPESVVDYKERDVLLVSLQSVGDYIVGWGSFTDGKPQMAPDGRFLKIDVGSKRVTRITPEVLGHLDGVQVNDGDSFVVSDWNTGRIFKVTKGGELETLLETQQGSGRQWLQELRQVECGLEHLLEPHGRERDLSTTRRVRTDRAKAIVSPQLVSSAEGQTGRQSVKVHWSRVFEPSVNHHGI